MNIAESFAKYLDGKGVATLGQDLFIGNAPSTNKVDDTIYWVVATGGDKTTALATGESIKMYFIELNMRSRDYKTVYNSLHALEEAINCDGCAELEDFEVIDASAAVLMVDNDLDNEDRKLGLLQVNITTHKSCVS